MSQKKNQPGCPCCSCEAIDTETLPTITISGWETDGVWGGTECCPCLTFTPITPVTSCSLSAVLATHERTVNIAYEVLGIPANAPMVYCPFPTKLGGDVDTCCQGDPVVVADFDITTIERASFRLKSKSTPTQIVVCFSRAEVTCDDASVGTKWIVRSVYSYNVGVKIVADLYSSIATTSNIYEPCFEYMNDCPISCEEERLASCDPGDTDLTTVCILDGGSHSFTRVKLYDTLPTGSISFTNADTPENCTWDYCDNPNEYLDEVCWTVGTGSGCLQNCVCYETISDPSIEERVTTKPETCCVVCPGPGPITFGQAWLYLDTSGDCDTTSVPVCIAPCPSPRSDCGDFVSNTPEFEITGPSTESCSNYITHATRWDSWFQGIELGQCFSGGIATQLYLKNLSDLEGFNPAFCVQFNARTPGDPCDTDCYWVCTCGSTEWCYPKWGANGEGLSGIATLPNFTSVTATWNCNISSSGTACLSAPSWSATFS